MRGPIVSAGEEPLARQTLRTYLRELGGRGTIHEAPDGTTAVALANHHRPELIFLDVVMPGATGLQVLEQLEYETRVIFTTAHDQYAVTAFELGALDYVLKPFGRERLERGIDRARIAEGGSAPPPSRAPGALQPAPPAVPGFRPRRPPDPADRAGEHRAGGSGGRLRDHRHGHERISRQRQALRSGSTSRAGELSARPPVASRQPRIRDGNRAVRCRPPAGGDEKRRDDRRQPRRHETAA